MLKLSHRVAMYYIYTHIVVIVARYYLDKVARYYIDKVVIVARYYV